MTSFVPEKNYLNSTCVFFFSRKLFFDIKKFFLCVTKCSKKISEVCTQKHCLLFFFFSLSLFFFFFYQRHIREKRKGATTWQYIYISTKIFLRGCH